MSRPPGTIGARHIIAGGLLVLLLLEGALRLVQAAVAIPPQMVVDQRVGWRGNPAFPEHDARGWRNAAALHEAEILVFGDSQTYGNNVAAKDAWPQQLSGFLGRSVYQMALPGYGPAHYLPLLEEALELHPRIVIAAYYFGNDMYDSYSLAYGVDRARARGGTLDLLLSTDSRTRTALARADVLDPMVMRTEYLSCSQRPVPGLTAAQLMRGGLVPGLRPTPAVRPVPGWRRVGRSIVRSSAVLRAARQGVDRLLTSRRPRAAMTDYGPPLCIHYRDQQLQTIFAAGYRFIAVDESDPRIVEGERLSLEALRYIAERCRVARVRFFVALIPTKEAAFRARAEGTLRGQSYIQDVWTAEDRAHERAVTFLARAGIDTIDTLPALAGVIASGVNPYREDQESHPIKPGYEAIAR